MAAPAGNGVVRSTVKVSSASFVTSPVTEIVIVWDVTPAANVKMFASAV